MKIEFYVVRSGYIADVYTSLKDAKTRTKELLGVDDFQNTVIIECYSTMCEVVFAFNEVRLFGRVIAFRKEYNKASEEERIKFLAKDFARNRTRGYLLSDCYVFAKDNDLKYHGSLNGKPADCVFLEGDECPYVEAVASMILVY